jgi:hypothetical protein
MASPTAHLAERLPELRESRAASAFARMSGAVATGAQEIRS